MGWEAGLVLVVVVMMVVILAMGMGGRVHARLAGGFTLADRGKPGAPA